MLPPAAMPSSCFLLRHQHILSTPTSLSLRDGEPTLPEGHPTPRPSELPVLSFWGVRRCPTCQNDDCMAGPPGLSALVYTWSHLLYSEISHHLELTRRFSPSFRPSNLVPGTSGLRLAPRGDWVRRTSGTSTCRDSNIP